MEGASVLSPSWWQKRRAWARQSRCWRTTVVEEEAATAMHDGPELQPPHLDDVFLEGSPSSKIETWLQECGSSMEAPPEELGLPGPYACGSNGTSFEDDLTLGAEALLLVGSDKATGRDKRLSLGHSMASSAPSSLTTKTSSSISEVLEWWREDAEEILYNLGFVQSEPGAVARVPARFFSAPSRARGIDFQLFLKAQVRRMEMEDPCLMLASRFQQVQALAATADAFFCLYSYVSRTPVQRISPSHLAWACPHVPEIRVAPPQPTVLSPVERLKKAVATMCLYTSPRGEDSPRATSQVSPEPPSQPSALGKVVQEDAPACCGGEREPSPRPPLAGTSAGAAWGRLEPSCPHGRGSGGRQGPTGVTAGTPPASDTPRAGGHWSRRSRGWRRGGPPDRLQPPRKGPSPQHPGWQEPVDSFELEEVLSPSEEEEEEDDGAAREEAVRSLHSSVRLRRSLMLHTGSGQSDSSGFVEEPVPGQLPTAQLHGTDPRA
ncbi:unnamed protein product [Bubo scandiacus]